MIKLESGIGHYITLKNRQYSYFAGNDYLGLANHPAIVNEVIHAVKQYGTNFSASRQTTGTSELHLELEKLLAELKNSQDASVFATGYMGNKLLLHVLKNQYSAIFADSRAHPSIVDAIPKDVSKVEFYEHCNPNHLESLLKRSEKHQVLIMTDGIFALTGEIAPLDHVCYLAEKYNAILIVDDAHATGVIGKNGRGTPEYFGTEGTANLFQAETMSKALGAYGGFIAAKRSVIREIRSKSNFYGASTALPPPIVAAGIASVKFIKAHPELREKLLENARHLRNGVKKMNFETTDEITPIIPVFFENRQSAKKMSKFLMQNNIIAPSVDYPVKTDKSIVRITVSASHTIDQIELLLFILKKWKNIHGF